MPVSSENKEEEPKAHVPDLSSVAAHQPVTSMRVMRTSPTALIACGLAFVSLILLLNFMTRTVTRADQVAAQQTTPGSRQQARTNSARSVEQARPQPSASFPQPKPSVETAVVPVVEAAPVPHKDDVERQQAAPVPTPAPAPPLVLAATSVDRSTSASRSEGGFTIQVGSFNELGQAEERAAKLGSAGVTAYVARVEIPKRGTWYRVQTGHFSSREEAVRYGTQLRAKGVVADFIVSPSKAT
jgi:cell division protein FtsN